MFKNLFILCAVATIAMTSTASAAFASCANGQCQFDRQDRSYYNPQQQYQQQQYSYQPQQTAYSYPQQNAYQPSPYYYGN